MSNLQQLKLASIVQKQVLKLSKKATTFSSGRLLSRTFSFSQKILMENRDAAQVVGPFKLEGQVTKGKSVKILKYYISLIFLPSEGRAFP